MRGWYVEIADCNAFVLFGDLLDLYTKHAQDSTFHAQNVLGVGIMLNNAIANESLSLTSSSNAIRL